MSTASFWCHAISWTLLQECPRRTRLQELIGVGSCIRTRHPNQQLRSRCSKPCIKPKLQMHCGVHTHFSVLKALGAMPLFFSPGEPAVLFAVLPGPAAPGETCDFWQSPTSRGATRMLALFSCGLYAIGNYDTKAVIGNMRP